MKTKLLKQYEEEYKKFQAEQVCVLSKDYFENQFLIVMALNTNNCFITDHNMSFYILTGMVLKLVLIDAWKYLQYSSGYLF